MSKKPTLTCKKVKKAKSEGFEVPLFGGVSGIRQKALEIDVFECIIEFYVEN